MGWYNPKVKDFLEENDPSMLGLYWALYWRFAVIIWGVVIVVAILAEL